MDIARELSGRVDRMSNDPLPQTWTGEPALATVGSFGELIVGIRRLDARSDDLLRAIGRLARDGDTEACLIVTAALLPLLIARCDRRPELIRDAIGELASRVNEPALEDPAAGVANRLLRRVVWRTRNESGNQRWIVKYPDPQALLDDAVLTPTPAPTLDPHEKARMLGDFVNDVADRVTLDEFRRRVLEQRKGREAWRLWTAVSDDEVLSSTERSRLAMHRRTLRQLARDTLVA